MNMAAQGMTPYSLRKGMASAPQLDTTRVSLVSRTVVKTYMKRNIRMDIDRKWGSSALEIGNLLDRCGCCVVVVGPPPLVSRVAMDFSCCCSCCCC